MDYYNTTTVVRKVFREHDSPLSWANAAHILCYSATPYFLMAYLTRKPNTHICRLLLLPMGIFAYISSATKHHAEDVYAGWFDWVRGLGALTLTAYTLSWAIPLGGTMKVGEASLEDRGSNESKGFFPKWFFDACEVGTAGRGIGWQFGQGSSLPDMRRPTERTAYLKATIQSIIRTYIYVDVVDSFLETLPGVTPTGGTLFLQDLPLLQRYVVSAALHLAIGLCVILGIEMWYDIASLVGVGLLNQPPSTWPPCHDRPWRTRSLHEFWSRRWHQILRHTFMVFGGYPGQWLAGDVGRLFGIFLASGLYHEVGFYLGGSSIDWKVIAFFVLQAVGILAEKSYTAYTGRRVGGWLGFSWAALFVVLLGQMCTNSWMERGAGGRAIVPPVVSPTRRLIFPLIRGA